MNRRALPLASIAAAFSPRAEAACSFPPGYPFALPHEPCGGYAFYMANRPKSGDYLDARDVIVIQRLRYVHPTSSEPITCSHCGGRISQWPRTRDVVDLREVGCGRPSA